ncbi:unnamed protein product, partial [Prunus brigantina]
QPIPRNYTVALEYHVALARYQDTTRRGTIEGSSSRPDRQCPTASTRRHRTARLALQEDQPQYGPPDHFEDTIEVKDVAATHDSNVDAEVEDVATTHDSNVEVDAEPTEPSRVGLIDPSLLTNKASKYEELLSEEQRNSSKGTYYKTPSSSVYLVEVESEEMEIGVAETAKLKHPISFKALIKPPKDQKPPPFTGGFVLNKPTQNKVYSFDLTKVDNLFDEMLLQKAIETPHQLP